MASSHKSTLPNTGKTWVQKNCIHVARGSCESRLIDKVEDEITKSGLGIWESTNVIVTRQKPQSASAFARLSKQSHTGTKNTTVLCIDLCCNLWGMVMYRKCFFKIKRWTSFFRSEYFPLLNMSYLNNLSFYLPFETPRPEMLYNADRWNSKCVPQTTSVPQTHFSWDKSKKIILTFSM